MRFMHIQYVYEPSPSLRPILAYYQHFDHQSVSDLPDDRATSFRAINRLSPST